MRKLCDGIPTPSLRSFWLQLAPNSENGTEQFSSDSANLAIPNWANSLNRTTEHSQLRGVIGCQKVSDSLLLEFREIATACTNWRHQWPQKKGESVRPRAVRM